MKKVIFALMLCVLMAGCTETQKQPVYGKGDPPAPYQKYFGNENGARLDWVQNQAIDQHNKVIAELAKRVIALESDPNELSVLPTETDWVGSPGVVNPDPYFINEGWLVGYEMGFRSDGVMVWKEKVGDPNEVTK